MNGSQFHDRHFTNAPLGTVPTTPAAPVDFQTDISGFKPDVHSWDDLGAIDTALAAPNSIVEWYDTDASLMRTTVLMVSSEATDTAQGVRRADDWAVSGLVWFQIGGAG